MSIHKLSEINDLNDPIKQFLIDFNISLPSDTFNFRANQLELRAQSFSFPSITVDKTEVWWGGHHRQYAGKQTRQGDWTVTFTEVWSGDVIDGFRKWMQKAHDFKGGTIATHEAYMTSADVNLLNPNLYTEGCEGAAAVEKKITLKMVYPTQVQVDQNIDPSSSEPVNLTCTLHYSYFLMADELDGRP